MLYSAHMENMEKNLQNNEGEEKPSFDQMHQLLITMGEEAKRRLAEQKTFEPGEKEMYERTIRQIEAFNMDPNPNKMN